MEVWEIGPAPTSNLAGSTVQRVFHNELTGKPTPPEPEMATKVIAIAADMAHFAPVLHDISDGGMAVALAEICIASGLGAVIIDMDTDLLFSEDPHRFLAVCAPESVELPSDMARRIGIMGGTALIVGRSDPIALDLLGDTYRNAIPRRMPGV
jgi:phosphoribosylformylglycinamidine synthase